MSNTQLYQFLYSMNSHVRVRNPATNSKTSNHNTSIDILEQSSMRFMFFWPRIALSSMSAEPRTDLVLCGCPKCIKKKPSLILTASSTMVCASRELLGVSISKRWRERKSEKNTRGKTLVSTYQRYMRLLQHKCNQPRTQTKTLVRTSDLSNATITYRHM